MMLLLSVKFTLSPLKLYHIVRGSFPTCSVRLEPFAPVCTLAVLGNVTGSAVGHLRSAASKVTPVITFRSSESIYVRNGRHLSRVWRAIHA